MIAVFQAVGSELQDAAAAIGKVVRSMVPPRTAFVVLLVKPGREGGASYVSNAQRQDVIRMLRELAQKVEGN